jgi:hypothetical protein
VVVVGAVVVVDEVDVEAAGMVAVGLAPGVSEEFPGVGAAWAWAALAVARGASKDKRTASEMKSEAIIAIGR